MPGAGDRSKRAGPLQRCAGFAIKRPRLVISAWLALIVVLGFVGSDLKSVLSNDDLVLKGSPSGRAMEIEREKFGQQETLAVLLERPGGGLRKSGIKAVGALERIEGVTVLSPWLSDAPQGMVPRQGQALLLLHVKRSFKDTGGQTAAAVKSTLRRTLPGDVHAYVTGTPVLGWALNVGGYRAAEQAEVIAAPILLVVLLLIFRSPIAAAIPLLLGISVLVSSTGVLVILDLITPLDEMAMTMMFMIGLALGVDYSLLVVSRFREELSRGHSVPEAVYRSAASAGRSVVFAGAVVAAGVALMTIIAPGALLVSGSIGIVCATLMSIAVATTLLPASLTLIGARIDRWYLGRRGRRPLLSDAVLRLTRRPGVAAALTLAVLAALSLPAFGLEIGPPDIDFLPPDDQTRIDANKVAGSAGEGASAPYVILVRSRKGPITSPKKLAALERFQREVAKDPMVENVFGPAAMAAGSKRINKAAREGDSQLSQLQNSLGLASSGASKLRRGMSEASTGSAQLASGSSEGFFGSQELLAGINRAQAGIASLQSGLERTAAGSSRLESALYRVRAGAADLKSAAYAASQGAGSIQGPAAAFKEEMHKSTSQLNSLKEPPNEAIASLSSAKEALDAAPLAVKADPNYQAAYQEILKAQAALTGYNPLDTAQQVASGYYGISAAIDRAVASSDIAAQQATELAGGADELASGMGSLYSGNRELLAATTKTRQGASSLDDALIKAAGATARLYSGTGEASQGMSSLAQGMGRMSQGSQRLHAGLDAGHMRSARLTGGLKRMQRQVANSHSVLTSQGSGKVDSVKVADSGYLTLAALEGSPAEQKRNANLVVNASHGGDTARVFVILDRHPMKDGASQFKKRLGIATSRLENEIGAEAMVGGRAAVLSDYDLATKARLIPSMVMVSIVSLIFLIVVFRSILLAVKAVILNLLTVGAAFGVVALLFNGPAPPLGGPGWVNALAVYGIYAIVFTISIDYEIFMVTRMRESYLQSGSNSKAIEQGVMRTARVITGGAAVMSSVFLAFAASQYALLMQFGIALTVAVIVDATMVRLVLLPATMRLFGRANWWLPKWLDRRLKRFDMEVSDASA